MIYFVSCLCYATCAEIAGDNVATVDSGGSDFLGLINISFVTPSLSLVMPITGGSPFLTNSYKPTSDD